ncbi:MAG: DNA polymerase/3'-5' exonuclease PolX, partial [Chloroflexi bacterium]|nr:DNA polymerase/3'-5' exonuclease PolX [Chloroflexota bacterium]
LRAVQALRKKKSEQRIPIGQALPLVEVILEQLRNVPGLKNLAAAGSLRRFQETVGDIDLMGTADDPAAVISAFTGLPQVKQVLGRGTTKASVIADADLKVDLRLVEHDAFGSLLQYFTGSKQHNINLRERARRLGLSLSEYGITVLDSGKLEKFATEEGFYTRQGLDWIPPEIREGGPEIELAERRGLPRLIEPADIRGDLHVHTDWSDGRNSIAEMARAACDRGYEYIGIADHTFGRGIARGLDAARLEKQTETITRLNQEPGGIRILSGSEVDIRADGALDLPDDILARLDFVIAGVHSSLNQSQEKITERLIKALANPHVDILAHPTGRQLPDREPSAIDMETLFRAAARNRTILEINAMPNRLDLKDTHVMRARELGVKLIISTDSHGAEQLGTLRFGTGVARRAWCRRQDIVNTWPVDDLLAYLRERSER